MRVAFSGAPTTRKPQHTTCPPQAQLDGVLIWRYACSSFFSAVAMLKMQSHVRHTQPGLQTLHHVRPKAEEGCLGFLPEGQGGVGNKVCRTQDQVGLELLPTTSS